MNMSATPPPATGSCDRAGARNDAREPQDPRACDTFELALQNRQRGQPSSEDGEEPPCESALLPAMPAALLARAQSLPPSSSAGAFEGATGTRAVIEASLRECPCPSITQIGSADPAMTWEATVHGPNSVAVEVRAVRTEHTTAGGPQAAWRLTIASPSVAVEVLARHAPRLNERLRKHGVGHVRIESAEKDDQ